MAWNINFLGTRADAITAVNALTGSGTTLETAQIALVKTLLKSQLGSTAGTTGSLYIAGPISLKAFGSMQADSASIHIELQPVQGVIGGKVISGGNLRAQSNSTTTT